MLLLSFYLINFFFMTITFIFSCSGMFRDVPGCSGMFRVPGFIDARFKISYSEYSFVTQIVISGVRIVSYISERHVPVSYTHLTLPTKRIV